MEKRLQQRLIGAAVIVALAVIFLPMLLNGGGDNAQVSVKMKIPPEPNYSFRSASEPMPPATTSAPAPTVQAVVPTPKQSAPPPPQPVQPKAAAKPPAAVPEPPVPAQNKAAVKAKPVTPSWVVQVASFSQESAAKTLREHLRKDGFSAYIDRFEDKGKAYYRVRVGPKLTRAGADQDLAKIEKAFKLKGIVVPYQ